MGDQFADIVNAEPEFLELWSDMLDVRAAHPQQVEARDRYFAEIDFGQGDVLEVGCGTGAITEALAEHAETRKVIGVDPSPEFIGIAQSRGTDAEFRIGDALALEFADASFDVAVFHTVLSHIPQPNLAIVEAVRVLRPCGMLAVFEGDAASMSVSVGPADPLAPCLREYLEANVHDMWFMRRCRHLLHQVGLDIVSSLVHGFSDPDYFVPMAERAIELSLKRGTIDAAKAQDLRDEVRQRVESASFYGHALYASMVAKKPASSSAAR